MIETILNPQALIEVYGYVGIFLTVFLETSVFFALPGDSLLFTSGILAFLGYINPWRAGFLIFIAAFSGGLVGYLIGYYLEKLRRFSFFRKILKQKHIDLAHKFFNNHGSWSIVLARFVPILRTFIPIVAGIAHMDLIKYLERNLIGALVWPGIVIGVGYFLGSIFPNLGNHLDWLACLVIFVSVFPILASSLKKVKLYRK